MKHSTVGLYCGQQTGESLVVTGDVVKIKFSSRPDSSDQGRGFLLHFMVVPVGKYNLGYSFKRKNTG